MSKERILVVDDSVSTLKALDTFLREEGFEVTTAKNGAAAEQTFLKDSSFEVVLADLRMPGMDGVELYRRLKSIDPNLLLIIMTAHGSIESSVEAMREGVYDYVLKPLNLDELLLTLSKALREKKREAELESLRNVVTDRYGFHNIIGNSPPMREVFKIIRAVAPTEATVLITGETGTGKEMFTRAIHFNSSRSQAPFICINCAALSESLLETELFGYVKGAFTGAESNRVGRLEAANQGTLFLDEVGHMGLPLQSKLLRFLQEGTFEPVGSITPRTVNVRVIAATNKDLEAEMEAKRFLPDLFYRLQVIQLNVPLLRQRKEDIPLLTEHFLKASASEHKRTPPKVTLEAMEALMSYHWPGNVRELNNLINRLVILGQSNEIGLKDLPANLRRAFQDNESEPSGCLAALPAQGVKLRDMEIELIQKTLILFEGNRSLTAKALGISRKSLYERIHRYGLE